MAFMFIMLCYCIEKLDIDHLRLRKGSQQLLKVLARARLKCVSSFARYFLLFFCCTACLLDIVTASFECNVFAKLNSV